MKTIIIIASISLILFNSSCDSVTNKSPEQLRIELKQLEASSPTRYLTIEGSTMKPNLVREAGLFSYAQYDGYLVRGTVKSTASLARFKDIVISVQLISQTGTVIENKDYVMYEFIDPYANKTFTIKMNPPSATKEFHVSVKSATPTI